MAVRYRDLERPALIDTEIPSTGGAQTAQSLSSMFSSFEQAGASIAAPIISQQGKMAGEAAGVAGKPQPRQGIAANTVYGRAYNSAAEVTYVSKQQTDIDATMDGIESANENNPDPIDYLHQADKVSSDLLKTAPAEYRPQLQLILQHRIAAGHARITQQAITKGREDAHGAYLEAVPAVINTTLKTASEMPGPAGDQFIAGAIADNNAKVKALQDNRAITPIEAAHYRNTFAHNLDKALEDMHTDKEVNALTGVMRSNVEAADKKLAGLEARKDLSSDQKEKIRSEYEKYRNQLTFERSRTMVNESLAVHRELAADGFGPHIESKAKGLYDKGAISVSEYEGIVEQNQRNMLKKHEDDGDMKRFKQQFEEGFGIDPADHGVVKAANKVFNQMVEDGGMKPGDERWQNTSLTMMHKTNLLPEVVESWTRRVMLHGTPEQALNGAGFLKRMQDENPAAAKYFNDPKIEAFAQKLNDNSDAGIPIERSYEMAHRDVYEQTDAQRNNLRDRYSADKATKENAAALNSVLKADKTFVLPGQEKHWYLPDHTPIAQVAMEAEFESMVKDYYTSTNGNIEDARKLATNRIQQLWGVSDVNGKPELMKYPPSKMYGLDTPTLKADIARVVDEAGLTGIDKSKVVMTPNSNTSGSQGRSWTLQYEDEYGAKDILRDHHNSPILYDLPAGHDIAKARAAMKAQKMIEDEAARDEAVSKRAEKRSHQLDVLRSRFGIAEDPSVQKAE